MINIPIGDWFLARSEAFMIFLTKFRDHKLQTKNAFAKVKLKHNSYDKTLAGYNERIEKLEKIIGSLQEVSPIKIKKKR
ncbi:hypothetical protein HYX16_03765 [Candidatus Woesearchaeota archaeon]|nr:hypothetical protein [Candidatus Woesearchaeota archaeon]